MNKRELQIESKQLIETSPKEALVICKKLWTDYPEGSPDQFNLYDALLTLKAAKKYFETDFNFVYEVATKYKEHDQIQNNFSWFVFYKYIKGRPDNEIIQYESIISKLIKIVPQKNSRIDDFPCPVTIAILKLVKAYASGMFNAYKVNEWLEKLHPQFLSKKVNIIPTKDKGDIEDASNLEKYYAQKTKALIKLEAYTDCEELCEKALKDLTEFHYDNLLWLRMRIAICEEHLGNIENSEQLFHKIIASKAGSDKWFIFKEIAILYFEKQDFENAWKYSIDAAFFGNEPKYMIGLYLLQARILVKLERVEESKILAQLIGSILKENEWKHKEEYSRILAYHHVDLTNINSVNSLYRKAKKFWISERYKGLIVEKGKIVFIHPRGKSGKIKAENGHVYIFHKRDFQQRQRNLVALKDSKVSYVKMTSFDGKEVAENIIILEKAEAVSQNDLVGKLFSGIVKNIKEFGVFVKLDGQSDGLIHKNALPNDIKSSFMDQFSIGQKVKVQIIKVSEKGLQLKLQ